MAPATLVAMATAEQTLNYSRPSALTVEPGRVDLLLSTSGGVTPAGAAEHPRFFDDFLGHPEQSAQALLTVARVARTRFYTPPNSASRSWLLDPVVTSNGDRLRFESFSACCGVYARFDALPGTLEGPALATGTSNVDVNPPMREALTRVGGIDPMHLAVGEDVVVTTMEGSVTEKKVPLPERWLRGFAEAQVAAAAMRPVFEVSIAEARRFLRSLPPASARGTFWVVRAGAGLRLASRPAGPSVGLSGAERLRVFEPLLRFARVLRVHAAEPVDARTPGASVWELDLADSRFVMTISPDRSRGFSGEGGVLWDLADEASLDDADLVSALLAFDPVIDVHRLARESALTPERVTRALGRLGAAGRVGYDSAEGAYFHRELPYDAAQVEAMHPRLAGARVLVNGRSVRIVDDAVARVTSGDVEYVVRYTGEGLRCTCPWFTAHHGTRGPCKHVLATTMVREG